MIQSRPGRARCASMASEYASSPEEQPTDSSRSTRWPDRASRRSGSTRRLSARNWSPCRKKYVSVMLSRSASTAVSSGHSRPASRLR